MKKPRANRFIKDPAKITGADVAVVLCMLFAAFTLTIVFI